MAQQLQLTREGKDRWRIPASTSCRTRLPNAQAAEHRIQSQCHRRRSERSRTPEERSSYLSIGELPKRIISRRETRREVRTSNATNAINDLIGHFLSDSVVTTGIYSASVQCSYSFARLVERTIIGSVLFSTDQQFGMEELAEGPGADLINGLVIVSLQSSFSLL